MIVCATSSIPDNSSSAVSSVERVAVIVDADLRESFLQHLDLVDRLGQGGSVTIDSRGGLQRRLHIRPNVSDSFLLAMASELPFQPLRLGACLSLHRGRGAGTVAAYSAAARPARAPNTSSSGSEFDPKRLAPLMLTHAVSPAA